MTFGADIPGTQRMNPNDFGALPLAPLAAQSFHLSAEKPQYLLDGMAQDFVQTFMAPEDESY